MTIQTFKPLLMQPPVVKNTQTNSANQTTSDPGDSFSPTGGGGPGGITNFNEAAADQQMFVADMRMAQGIQKDTQRLLASKDPAEVGRALTASQQRLAKMNARKGAGPQIGTNFAYQAVEHQVKALSLHLNQLQAAPKPGG